MMWTVMLKGATPCALMKNHRLNAKSYCYTKNNETRPSAIAAT